MKPNNPIQLDPRSLPDYPLQAATYAKVTDADNERLNASMQTDGQRDPVHVLSIGNKAGLAGYTVLDGHRRRDAAVTLGWSEVDVLVRCDLADADYNEVANAFLDYNANRRQLDPLDQAVVLVRRYEIETGRPAERWDGENLNEVTARLEPFLAGKGNKTSRRNVKVACLPAPIIQAYREGRLKLTVAEKVFTLKPRYRQQIADAIADATRDNPAGKVNDQVLEAVYDLVPKREPSEGKLSKHLNAVCKVGEDFIAAYDDRLYRITHPSWGENYLARIEAVQAFVGRLRDQLADAASNPDPLKDVGRSCAEDSVEIDTVTTTDGHKATGEGGDAY